MPDQGEASAGLPAEGGGTPPVDRHDDDAIAAVSAERSDTNRKRMRVLAPLMFVVHAAHVWHFHVPSAARATLTADVLRWRDALVIAHGAMLPFVALLTIVTRLRAPRLLRLVGPVAAAGYLLHAAIVTGIDQIMVANMTVYAGYSLFVALVVALAPIESALVFAIGATALFVALTQGSDASRATNLPTAMTLTVVSVVLAWMTDAARRRELSQRRVIARQKAELAELNAGLERRVADQVKEIVARVAEVERLNAELSAQVKERSSELSLALERLAKQGGPPALARGTVVADRFVVGERIGEGGMGVVYAGVDRVSGGRVAIKILQAASSRELDALRRFLREAGATATVMHPAIVRMLHVDVTDDGLLFQVQELVEGETLANRLDRAWTAAEAARLGAVLCDALAAAHAHGVIHRDVKPDNVMLTTTAPGLKLLDFGIAKRYDVSLGHDTTEAVVLGTPQYMAPEQISGTGDIAERADLYAVGVILYRLVAGRLPFDAPTARELMAQKLFADGPAPLLGLPDTFATALRRCLERDPSRRPSAAELAGILRAVADDSDVAPLETLPATLPPAATATVAERRRT